MVAAEELVRQLPQDKMIVPISICGGRNRGESDR
jgi:hypothetical protein